MTIHESMLQAYRLLVPYCFVPDEDNPLLLTSYNRNYDEIPKARILFRRDPETFRGVWAFENGADQIHPANSHNFYMYNDNPASRKDYWERLGKLYSHKHTVIGDHSLDEFKTFYGDIYLS